MLLLIVLYSSGFAFIPPLSTRVTVALHFVHALGWCLFHCFGLGLLLRAQSEQKYLVRHYMKNYHYPHHDGGNGAVLEAFSNWKAVYNMSQCMSYGQWVISISGRSVSHFIVYSVSDWPRVEDV